MIAIEIKQQRGEVIDFRSSLVELLKIWLVIKPLQYFYKADSEYRLSAMRTMPVGTIGKFAGFFYAERQGLVGADPVGGGLQYHKCPRSLTLTPFLF